MKKPSRSVTRKCKACGAKFRPARADARYCSAGCRQRAYRARAADTDFDRDIEASRLRYWQLLYEKAVANGVDVSSVVTQCAQYIESDGTRLFRKLRNRSAESPDLCSDFLNFRKSLMSSRAASRAAAVGSSAGPSRRAPAGRRGDWRRPARPGARRRHHQSPNRRSGRSPGNDGCPLQIAQEGARDSEPRARLTQLLAALRADFPLLLHEERDADERPEEDTQDDERDGRGAELRHLPRVVPGTAPRTRAGGPRASVIILDVVFRRTPPAARPRVLHFLQLIRRIGQGRCLDDDRARHSRHHDPLSRRRRRGRGGGGSELPQNGPVGSVVQLAQHGLVRRRRRWNLQPLAAVGARKLAPGFLVLGSTNGAVGSCCIRARTTPFFLLRPAPTRTLRLPGTRLGIGHGRYSHFGWTKKWGADHTTPRRSWGPTTTHRRWGRSGVLGRRRAGWARFCSGDAPVESAGTRGTDMQPMAHTFVKAALALLGMFLGSVCGAGLLQSGWLRFLGDGAGGILVISALLGAILAPYLWVRMVPVRCPTCPGRMTRTYLGSRQFAFICAACGRREWTI
jgi:hypothetical protein